MAACSARPPRGERCPGRAGMRRLAHDPERGRSHRLAVGLAGRAAYSHRADGVGHGLRGIERHEMTGSRDPDEVSALDPSHHLALDHGRRDGRSPVADQDEHGVVVCGMSAGMSSRLPCSSQARGEPEERSGIVLDHLRKRRRPRVAIMIARAVSSADARSPREARRCARTSSRSVRGRRRGGDQEQGLQAGRPPGRERQRDLAAHRVADETVAGKAERSDQRRDIVRGCRPHNPSRVRPSCRSRADRGRCNDSPRGGP